MSSAAPEIVPTDPPVAGIFGAEVSAQQLDLLHGPMGEMPTNVFQLARAEGEKRGPGRPKGSVNKRSMNLAAVLEAKHSDPVLFQAAVYDMPLDQLCRALLIADGSAARQERLDELIGKLADNVGELTKKAKAAGVDGKAIERLADACEALEGAARRSQGKPGDVALKALNLQLAAARTVAEYKHSKKPVEAVVKHQHDAMLVMPAASQPGFTALDEQTRQASEIIGMALIGGTITADQLVGLKLENGQLVDAEFSEVEGGGDA